MRLLAFCRKRYFSFLFLISLVPSAPLFAQEQALNLDQQLPTNDGWWKLFGDSMLDSLIRQATINNYDLKNAVKNIEIARRRTAVARSSWFPELSTTVSYSPEKNSLGIEHINERNYTGQAQLEMNWEIDVFGSIRKNVEAEKAYYSVSKENYRAVMVSLMAQLSAAYIQLRTYQTQLKVARQNLQSQKEILDLTETRFKTGLTSRLDVSQAKSLYLQTSATIPEIEASIISQVNSVCILTGEYTDSLRRQLLRPGNLPENKNLIMNGIPANLIRRRPDVRAAEKTMDALAAAVGASRADWFPQFYVTGSFGYGSDKFEHFFRRENMDWQITPSMKWTFFSGRKMNEATHIAQLQLEEGINDYNNTLLTALQEVDDALTTYNKSLQQLKAYRQTYSQGKETLSLATDLYRQGLTNYQNVLDSQRDVFNYQNALVSSESHSLLYLIQLYKALGGGWTNENNKVKTDTDL